MIKRLSDHLVGTSEQKSRLLMMLNQLPEPIAPTPLRKVDADLDVLGRSSARVLKDIYLCARRNVISRPTRQLDVLNRETTLSWLPTKPQVANEHAKAAHFNKVGMCHLHRFSWLHDPTDIEASIECVELALKLTSDSDPENFRYLCNLGRLLWQRFIHYHRTSDADDSFKHFDRALGLRYKGRSDCSCSEQVAGSTTKDPALIQVEQRANVNVLEDRSQRFVRFPNEDAQLVSDIGTLFLARFTLSGNLTDINEMTAWQEQSAVLDRPFESKLKYDGSYDEVDNKLALASYPDPDEPRCLNIFGRSLLARFQRFADGNDLPMALIQLERAIQLADDADASISTYLNDQGNALLCCSNVLDDPRVLELAISYFASAACSFSGPPAPRFEAACSWAKYARICKHPSLFYAYVVAIDLLPQLASIGLPINRRLGQITPAGPLLRDAVGAAVDLGFADTALEWMELGRSVIWQQQLQLRTPVDDIRSKEPELAEHVSRAFQKLRQDAQNIYTGLDTAENLEELRGYVQKLPGFAQFLSPKTLAQLIPAAHAGSVVVLNISSIRCDALIVRPGSDDVLAIPLVLFTLQDAERLQQQLFHHLNSNGQRRAAAMEPTDSCITAATTYFEGHFVDMLSELWFKIVKPVLVGLEFTVTLLSILIMSTTFISVT